MITKKLDKDNYLRLIEVVCCDDTGSANVIIKNGKIKTIT